MFSFISFSTSETDAAWAVSGRSDRKMRALMDTIKILTLWYRQALLDRGF